MILFLQDFIIILYKGKIIDSKNKYVTVKYKNLSSIIMKTKPNFTYKEFIQKISNVQIKGKQNLEKKSPKILKKQSKNTLNVNVKDSSFQKQFEKKYLIEQKNQGKNLGGDYSPLSKVKKQSNDLRRLTNKSNFVNTKESTNKLKLKSSQKIQQQNQKESSIKRNKNINHEFQGNFYQNQYNFTNQKHLTSCSNFSNKFVQNSNQNQEDYYPQYLRHNASLNSKLLYRKNSKSTNQKKIKIANKGNLTGRSLKKEDKNGSNLNKYQDRINTQYINYDRQSPSFYQKSMDQSNFLDIDAEIGRKGLFEQVSTSRSKKQGNKHLLSVKTTEKSYEHVYNKFINSISDILLNIIKIEDRNKLLEHKIKYIEYLECLKELKLIKNDYQPYSQKLNSIDLVKQMWEQLVMGHNVNHFIIIISIILKITPLEQIQQNSSQEIENYIYLQNKYQQFRFTRLQLTKSKIYSQKDSKQFYNYSFKPSISKRSQQIASKSKSRKKYQINTSVISNHNQSLNLTNQRQNISLNTDLDNSTFFHNQSVTSPSISLVKQLGNRRSEILYNQGKKCSLQKRQKHDKSTIDYEYQKNKSQLTFKPKITLKRKKQKNDNFQLFKSNISPRLIQDEQKTINRMIRGRVEKQIKQLTISKGLPYNEKVIDKLRKQKFQQILKEQQQAHLKICHHNSKWKIKNSQNSLNFIEDTKNNRTHSMSYQNNSELKEPCSSRVQNLENILDLSFQELTNTPNNETLKDQDMVMNQMNQQVSNLYQHNDRKKGKLQRHSQQMVQNEYDFNVLEDPIQSPQDYFILDIYFQEDRSQKLLIKKDSSLEQVSQSAQNFVRRHNLPQQMEYKLKQQLMIAMKFHDIQKIEENAQQQECSLLM